jgi:peptidoglycan hydrolase CwlO-like protein
MTIGEEKEIFKQISDLSSKVSYLEGEIWNAKEKFKNLQEVVDKTFALTDYRNGEIQGYQNVLNMFAHWINRNTKDLEAAR